MSPYLPGSTLGSTKYALGGTPPWIDGGLGSTYLRNLFGKLFYLFSAQFNPRAAGHRRHAHHLR